jgi:hypothetical protein
VPEFWKTGHSASDCRIALKQYVMPEGLREEANGPAVMAGTPPQYRNGQC